MAGKHVRKPVRVITSTISRRRAFFNQAVMEQAGAPDGILFVAIDPEKGLYLWLRPYSAIEPEATTEQAGGYSRTLKRVDPSDPPTYFGEPVFISAASVEQTEAGLWQRILDAHTNTKNKLIRDLFGF